MGWFDYIKRGNIKKIEELIHNGVNINMQDEFGCTGVMIAVKYRDKDILKLLIDYGADVNIRDQMGNTAIIFAAESDVNTLQLLIDAGADINSQNMDGDTVLINSAVYNNLEIMKKLLEYYDIDTNKRDRYGFTAYDCASSDGKQLITSYLNKKKVLTFLNSEKIPKDLYHTVGKFLFGKSRKKSKKRYKRKYLLV